VWAGRKSQFQGLGPWPCLNTGLVATNWGLSCPCCKTEGGWRAAAQNALGWGGLPALKGSSDGFSALVLSWRGSQILQGSGKGPLKARLQEVSG
jgi:hypothetical protein